MLNIRKFTFYFFQENTYIVWDDSLKCAIIDPGCQRMEEREQLYGFIGSEGLTPEVILLTHGHLDHIYGVRECAARYGVPVRMSKMEERSFEVLNTMYIKQAGLPEPDKFPYDDVSDGEIIKFGNTEVRVLATPGHSLGGVCYWVEKENAIFTGDTLFAGSVGRTDNDAASLEELQKSLRDTLMKLDGEIDVYPGHGPSTSIGVERVSNPFIYEDYTLQDLLATDEN